jgi:hypothetical protein
MPYEWNGAGFIKNDGGFEQSVYNIVGKQTQNLVKEYYILTLLLGSFKTIISVHYGLDFLKFD